MSYNSNAYSGKKQNQAQTNSEENLFDPAKVEWVQVAPNKTVVATSKKTYLIDLNTEKCSSLNKFFRDRPTNLIEGASNVAITRKLLDSAIAAAKYGVNSDAKPPALTVNRCVWRLAGAYHLTHLVPCLLEELASSFALTDRFILSEVGKKKSKRGSRSRCTSSTRYSCYGIRCRGCSKDTRSSSCKGFNGLFYP